MPFRLDHVFICCAEGAPEARALLDAGLVEGSRNTHPGQGTENRRFFFAGGMIELLWISDHAEATSALSAPTRLWQRWSGRHAGCCPFGVAFGACFGDGGAPPFPTWTYRPRYLPDERRILFARDTPLDEPELFCLPWFNAPVDLPAQPRSHTLPLLELRSVAIGLPKFPQLSPSATAAAAAGLVSFHASAGFELVLRFRSPEDLHCDLRPMLPLILEGRTRG